MANSAKSHIEVLFKKNHLLTLRIYIKNILSEESVNLHILITFTVIVSCISPESFIEIHEVSLNEMNYYFFGFNYFRQFFGFFYLHLLQKS